MIDQHIERLLLSDGPLWFPFLSQLLVQAWGTATHLSSISYSTSHFFSEGKCRPNGEILVGGNDMKGMTTIEVLAETVATAYQTQGLRFVEQTQALGEGTYRCVQEAFTVIEATPTLAATLRHLALRMHVIHSEGDGCDASYSDPKLPFSIFVSIPSQCEKHAILRLAEGIIHETMHLQLSLIEKFVPMIGNQSSRFYSPWRSIERPVGGVLHGLYVFGVIHQWLGNSEIANDYARQRRIEIKEEIKTILEFPSAAGLTSLGRVLASKVIDVTCRDSGI